MQFENLTGRMIERLAQALRPWFTGQTETALIQFGDRVVGSALEQITPRIDNLQDGLAASTGASLVGWGDATVMDALDLALPYANRVVDVLIVYGQSNARGYASSTPGAPTVIPSVARMWNGSALVPLTAYTPSANDGTSTGSAWAAFGSEYCSATGRGLVVVNCAKGSQSISDLSKPGTNYTAMTTFVNNAVAAIAAEGSTLGKVLFAFNQGERDSQLKTTAADYGAALAQLWADVKADFGAIRMGIFTVGYYATADMLWGQLIQQAQRLFARNTEDAFIAYDWLGSFGSHNKLKVDGVHYTQRGYNIMGREGARRFVAAEFPDSSAPVTDEQIKRFGSLNMGQSQAWNLHAGFFQKSGTEPGWTVNHTSPRASSLVTDIDAASDTYKLNVKLACPARTVMFADARFHGPLAATGIRAVVNNALSTTATWPSPNADGVTVVPIYFYGDIHLRIDMAAGSWDNSIMGATLASLKDSISVAFTSTGVVTITHPTCQGLAKAAINGSLGRHVRVSGAAGSTTITVKDGADANVNDVIHVTLFNMAIPHADLPVTAELSFAMIAADYAIW